MLFCSLVNIFGILPCLLSAAFQMRQALLNLLAVSSNGISYIVAENGENVKGNANKNVCPAKSFRVPADP